MAGLSGWRFRVFEVASDRPFRATNLSRNIDNVRALLAHLLYHVKVLSAQHAGLSIVKSSQPTAQVEGAYRLIRNPSVSPQALQPQYGI